MTSRPSTLTGNRSQFRVCSRATPLTEARTAGAHVYLLRKAGEERIFLELLEEGAHSKLLAQHAGQRGLANAYHALDDYVDHALLYPECGCARPSSAETTPVRLDALSEGVEDYFAT